MHRKLFTLAAGASALQCAAVCVLGVRSYYLPVNPDFGPSPETLELGRVSIDSLQAK